MENIWKYHNSISIILLYTRDKSKLSGKILNSIRFICAKDSIL